MPAFPDATASAIEAAPSASSPNRPPGGRMVRADSHQPTSSYLGPDAGGLVPEPPVEGGAVCVAGGAFPWGDEEEPG